MLVRGAGLGASKLNVVVEVSVRRKLYGVLANDFEQKKCGVFRFFDNTVFTSVPYLQVRYLL